MTVITLKPKWHISTDCCILFHYYSALHFKGKKKMSTCGLYLKAKELGKNNLFICRNIKLLYEGMQLAFSNLQPSDFIKPSAALLLMAGPWQQGRVQQQALHAVPPWNRHSLVTATKAEMGLTAPDPKDTGWPWGWKGSAMDHWDATSLSLKCAKLQQTLRLLFPDDRTHVPEQWIDNFAMRWLSLGTAPESGSHPVILSFLLMGPRSFMTCTQATPKSTNNYFSSELPLSF